MNEELKNNIIDEFVSLAQGNPGAATVFAKLLQDNDTSILVPLLLALKITKTKAYAVWILHKDVCKFDLLKTKKELKKWFDSCSDPLEEYLERTK